MVDAEIVDDGDELTATMRSRARVESDDGLLIPPDSDEHGSAFDTAPGINPLLPPEPPPTGLMSLEDAVAEQCRMRREPARRAAQNEHATMWRALLDGRSLIMLWHTVFSVSTRSSRSGPQVGNLRLTAS